MSGAGLLGALCGLIGTFMLLRKRALMGDVMAHATLPGLALMFIFTQSKNLPLLLLGAFSTACLAGAFLTWIQKNTPTKEDAAMGVILSSFFGFGIALIRWIQTSIPSAEKAGLESYIFGKASGILLADTLFLLVMECLIIGVVLIGSRIFKVSLFDSSYAFMLGVPIEKVDFLLLVFLAVTLTLGLPMVGVVLVATLCILPSVCASFWFNSYHNVLIAASLLGGIGSSIGVAISSGISYAPTGPCIILTLGALLIISILFAPHKGVISRSKKQRENLYQLTWESVSPNWIKGSDHNQLVSWLNEQGVQNPPQFLRWINKNKDRFH